MPITEKWSPPNQPDPLIILREALVDAAKDRHAVALAKLVWLHESSLTNRLRFSSVRRTFVLEYWRRIGKVYLPAMEALHRARDAAEAAFYQSSFNASSFQDLAALNRTLGKQDNTVDAFKVADRTDRNSASLIYSIAESSLMLQGEYALCGKHVDPKRRIGLAIRRYERSLVNKHGTHLSSPHTARKHLVQNVTNLVTILVKNNRTEEAKRACAAAQAQINDERFDRDLRFALARIALAIWPEGL